MFYFVALIGTRALTLLSVLILSHVMVGDEFGYFTLVNTNSLLIELLVGGWLISVANRVLVSETGYANAELLAGIKCCSAILVCIILIVAGCLCVVGIGDPGFVFGVAILSSALIIYDLTLGIKNALGREVAYAGFALTRNGSSLGLSVALVLLGAGWWGPVAGLVIATLGAVVAMPSVREIWTRERLSILSVRLVLRHAPFGLSGSILLSSYILLNAISRNLMAFRVDAFHVGVWSLVCDLFYGPIAVIGNTFSLSQLRLLYLAVEDGEQVLLSRRSREFLEFAVCLAVPYAVGGALFAPEVAGVLLAPGQVPFGKMVAVAASVQAAGLMVLYSLAAIALASGRLRLVAAMVASAALAVAVAAFFGTSGAEIAGLSALAVCFCVFSWVIWCAITGLVPLSLVELTKLAAATCALWGGGVTVMHYVTGSYGWIVAALVASATFVLIALALRLRGLCSLGSCFVPGRDLQSDRIRAWHE